MPATPFDSAILKDLFGTGEVARLFGDSAEVRAMMLVEGSLAKVQGAGGVIPELSAQAIHRAALELQIDPGGLARATGANGVCVPALVAAFRDLMQAPEHAQYVHWGATSQDIMDTGLMLRLRQVLAIYDAALAEILGNFADLADRHADLPMLNRTYGQHATMGSFGAQVALWGAPLLDLRSELQGLRKDGLWVSLGGAAGTASELGPEPAALRAALADALDLTDPGRVWHSDRSPIQRIASWVGRVLSSLGKLGEDLLQATQSDVAEVSLGGGGASSTMPQKQNPVGPSVLVALSRHGAGLLSSLQIAGIHRQQRDGSAWFVEWLTLPQLCLSLAAALEQGKVLSASIAPNAARMRRNLASSGGMIFAEALTFELARRMPRPEAQAQVKELIKAMPQGQSLQDAALTAWPDLSKTLFDAAQRLGTAPGEAHGFAGRVRGFAPVSG